MTLQRWTFGARVAGVGLFGCPVVVCAVWGPSFDVSAATQTRGQQFLEKESRWPETPKAPKSQIPRPRAPKEDACCAVSRGGYSKPCAVWCSLLSLRRFQASVPSGESAPIWVSQILHLKGLSPCLEILNPQARHCSAADLFSATSLSRWVVADGLCKATCRRQVRLPLSVKTKVSGILGFQGRPFTNLLPERTLFMVWDLPGAAPRRVQLQVCFREPLLSTLQVHSATAMKSSFELPYYLESDPLACFLAENEHNRQLKWYMAQGGAQEAVARRSPRSGP